MLRIAASVKISLWAAVLSAVFMICGWVCLLQYEGVSAVSEELPFYGDGKGTLRAFQVDENGYGEYDYSKDVLNYQYHPMEGVRDVYCLQGKVVLEVFTEYNTALIERESLHTVYIDQLCIRKDCMTCNHRGDYYLVSDEDDRSVYVYGSGGRRNEVYRSEAPIMSLFTDPEGSVVYGVTEQGIWNVRSGKILNCPVPEGRILLNSRYYTDQQGNVFCFDDEVGFMQLNTSDYSISCVTSGGIVYAAREDILYRLDGSGEPVAYQKMGRRISRLLSDGKTVAAMSGERIFAVNTGDFLKIHQDSMESSSGRPPEEKEDSGEGSAEIGEQSSEEKSNVPITPAYCPASSVYRMENGYIMGIPPGTTFSKLKENIEYEGYAVAAVNHNGKIVSSGKLGTGWELRFRNANQEYCFLTVVKGDLTGEGNINDRDTLRLSGCILGKNTLEGAFFLAADTDQNGQLDMKDLYDVFSMY